MYIHMTLHYKNYWNYNILLEKKKLILTKNILNVDII